MVLQGRVRFDEHGTRQENTVRVEQYRPQESGGGGGGGGEVGVVRVLVAHLTGSGMTLAYTAGENDSTVFPGTCTVHLCITMHCTTAIIDLAK